MEVFFDELILALVTYISLFGNFLSRGRKFQLTLYGFLNFLAFFLARMCKKIKDKQACTSFLYCNISVCVGTSAGRSSVSTRSAKNMYIVSAMQVYCYYCKYCK